MKFVRAPSGLMIPHRQRGMFAMGPGFFAQRAPIGGGATTRIAAVGLSGDGSNFDHSKTLPAFAVSAGNLIVVKFSGANSGHISSITDTAGNTYTKGGSNLTITGGNTLWDLWYCLASAASASNVVIVNFDNGNATYGLTAEAYSGGTFTFTSIAAKYGPYSTASLTSNTITASAGDVISTLLSQYDDSTTGRVATIAPGDVIYASDSASVAWMASVEDLPTSAFSGTLTANFQTNPTPAYTKLDLVTAVFHRT